MVRGLIHFVLVWVLALATPLVVAGTPEHNLEAGRLYLQANSAKEGVKVTDSGLQYEVLKTGSGKSPLATDTVTVNYKGTTIDGKQFDSSDNISFPLNRVIPGWTEGLQLMKEGASYRFTIPAALAYGERGAGGVIGPNEVLVFEVDLLSVN